MEKGKEREKTTEEHCKEFEKGIIDFSPLEDVVRPPKKRKVTMKKKVLK